MLKINTYKHKWIMGKRYYDFGVYGEFPGVTSILNQTKSVKDAAALKRWRLNVGEYEANRICQLAQDRGKKLHSAIEYSLMHKKKSPNRHEIPGWWDNAEPLIKQIINTHVVEGLETPIFSKEHNYAGTFDCLLLRNNQFKLIDWKTSSKPKQLNWITDYFLQLSAYSAALYERYGIEVDKGVVVIFLEHSTPQIFEISKEELNGYFQDFIARVRLFYGELRA